jgi:hypothetical protein
MQYGDEQSVMNRPLSALGANLDVIDEVSG